MDGATKLDVLLVSTDSVFTVEQAAAMGVTKKMIRTRVDRGEWRRIFPGVIIASMDLATAMQRWRAALLYMGPDAYLAGASAAAWRKYWTFTSVMSSPVDVMVDRAQMRSRHAHRGVNLHRTRELPQKDLIFTDGLQGTNAIRAVIDLCEFGARHDVVALFAHLERKGFIPTLKRRMEELRHGRDLSLLDELLSRAALKRGPVDSPGEAVVDDILWELGFIAHRQYPVQPDGQRYWLDLAIVALKLDFEVDGFEFHVGRFYEDRERDIAVATCGWLPVRITWPELLDRPRLARRLLGIIVSRAQQLGVSLSSLKRTAA